MTAGSLAVLIAGLGLAGCSAPQAPQAPAPKAVAVPRAGGTIRLSPKVRLGVAAGVSSGTVVRANQVPNTSAYPGGLAEAVGPAVDIRPSGPMPATIIRMRFDPGKDLPPARPGAAAPTAGNAFIAVFDKPAQTWLPLTTRYDRATHELTVLAPHFSIFREFVTRPGKFFLKNVMAGVSVAIRAGESGVGAAQAMGDAVWQAVKPEFGWSYRRTLPSKDRIDRECAGNDAALPWDRRYKIILNDESMKIHSCVVDHGADLSRPLLLMENDYGFPVDVFPQPGAVLPELTVGEHPDQDALAALASLAGLGYIPGPGVTHIGLPTGPPTSFTVKARADWLGLATDMILTSAAIIPGFEASETKFTVTLERVIAQMERNGQRSLSVTDTLRIVSKELKVEEGPIFKTAEHLTATYICFSDLGHIVETDKISDLVGKVVSCLKELVPSPHEVVTSGGVAVLENARYLESLMAFAQLPAVLNDFREHGREVFTVQATRSPTVSISSLVGDWSGHSRIARISPSGFVTVEWRTYTICGTPEATPGHACESASNPVSDGGHATMQLQQQGGSLVAHVLTSNDSYYQGDMPVVVLKRGSSGQPVALSVGRLTSKFALTFCTPSAPVGYCGA